MKQRVQRRTAVHSITWFASGQEFLSIETNEAVHIDVQGKTIDRYPFERLQLHDVAITRDGSRLFAVATLEQSKEGLRPVKARVEKRIVIYNRSEKVIEKYVWALVDVDVRFADMSRCCSQVPVLHDVRDITLSHDDKFALISYEDKVCLIKLSTIDRPTEDVTGPSSTLARQHDQGRRPASIGSHIHAKQGSRLRRTELLWWAE